MALIFWFSHQPRVMDGLPPIDGLDKVFHFIAYFVLGLTFVFAYFKNGIIFHYLPGLISSVIYSWLDEFHQTFIPTRSFEIGDLVADFCGALCATLLLRYILERMARSDMPMK